MTKHSNRWLCAFIPLLFVPASVGSSAEVSPEAIKASYILKLRQFVKVENSSRHINSICYYEKAGVPYSESVGQIMAKYVQENVDPSGKGMDIKWIKAIRNLSTAGCDVFYIPASEDSVVDNIISSLGDSSTMTVSAADRFIQRGGMLGFLVDAEGRVKMSANLENIRKKGVWIDAGILEIMEQVIGANR